MILFYRLSMRTWLFSQIFTSIIGVSYGVSPDLFLSQQVHPSTQSQYSERLFDSDEVLQLTILSDFSAIMDDRGEDRSYHKGRLYYLNAQGDTIRRSVKLKTRGNFRRDPANCKYPPIMVKFGKLKSADSVFTDQSKLKLVTLCQLEDYVLLEYLAYRFYNQLTSNSYRVRLAHITYSDIETREAYFTKYAFFIEREKDMTDRLNLEEYKPNVVQYFLDRENVITMAMFQYMIGNDDWYVTSKHNTSILNENNSEKILAVPYDFDWSMLVNASYTKPENVPDRLLKDRRVYKGLCMEAEEFEYQRELFISKKDQILEFIKMIDGLSKRKRKEAENYIETFYKIINESSSLQEIFQKEECVKEPVFPKK